MKFITKDYFFILFYFLNEMKVAALYFFLLEAIFTHAWKTAFDYYYYYYCCNNRYYCFFLFCFLE